MTSCCKTSCWCAPFRWIVQCCCPPSPPSAEPQIDHAVQTVAIQAIGGGDQKVSVHQNLAQHRGRTWQLSNGRMSYVISETEK